MKKSVLILLALLSSHLSLASQALINAARYGDVGQVTRLMAENDDVNDVDGYDHTALILAARIGNVEVVNVLLCHPKNLINHTSMGDKTALMWAAMYGYVNVVRTLLTRPEILTTHRDINGHTAFTLAAVNGHIEVVNALLARPEILINQANKDGYTASELATSKGHTEIAQLIHDVALARSQAHLLSPKIEEITKLPPELSDVVTNYLTGSEDPRNVRQTQGELRELPFHGQDLE